MVQLLLGWLTVSLLLSGAAAQDFVGGEACRPCHAREYRVHRSSPHFGALTPIVATDLPERLQQRPIAERNGFSFRYEEQENVLNITVHDGETAEGDPLARGTLEWVFGGGSQGRTPVGRANGRWFEHRVSYYARPDRLAITLGHPLEPPRRAAAALGRTLSAAEAQRCFGCHATGVRLGFDGPDLSRMRPGVQCERCHGPGGEHVRVAGEAPERAAAKIESRRGSAGETLAFCGQCHRTDESKLEPGDPLNVRFQPIGLARSRCFQNSNALTCSTCHDPHEGARKDAAAYSAVCARCHAAEQAPPGCGRSAGASCLPCHMPRERPNAYLEFTDHHIRVVGAAAATRPR